MPQVYIIHAIFIPCDFLHRRSFINEDFMKKQSKTKTFKSLEAAQREVDIQVALEGIRALAMAMQSTEDIGPVVVETRDALMEMGIKPYRTHIDLVDEGRDLLSIWTCKARDRFWNL
jgi:hypothetical protein